MVNARNSHGNACGLFISLEGWRILAGGSTPGAHLVSLHPSGVLESTVGYLIRLISPIRHIPPLHPRSKPLIKVATSLSPTFHKPIIRPKNKGIKPNTNCHKPKKIISKALHPICVNSRNSRKKLCASFVSVAKKKSLFSSFPWSIPSRLVQPEPT